MATPYLQFRFDTVASTQDVARERFDRLPVLVLASGQREGRGRAGSAWLNADRALAASLATELPVSDQRPFSLMAGVAATRATEGTMLKWPNDVLVGELKIGGILVERSESLIVIGLGLNVCWSNPPRGAGALYADDPGADVHAEIGALWGAELMRLMDGDGWPIEEYESRSATLGKNVTWDPDGSGTAIEIASDGGLVVALDNGKRTILHSGAIRHLRH